MKGSANCTRCISRVSPDRRWKEGSVVSLIGIDARKYFDFGIGTYIENLVDEVGKNPGRFDLVLYVTPSDLASMPVGRGWRIVPVPFKKYSLAELFLFARRVRRDRIELFHEPHYTLPFHLSVPAVVSVHDLIHTELSEYFTPLQREYARFVLRHAVAAADAVIVLTEFMKGELLSRYPGAGGKIHVIPLGVDAGFLPRSGDNITSSFGKKFGLAKPFILYAGSLKPHKNIPVLLTAFARFTMRQEIDLVFVGERLRENPELVRLLADLGLGPEIHDLGKIGPGEVRAAFRSADCVVLPSEYEGFGLPLIEAMACGTPVIISDAPALTEVAGGAAMVFERKNVESLAAVLERVFADASLRTECAAKGISRSGQFTWLETGRRTMALYESLLARKGGGV